MKKKKRHGENLTHFAVTSFLSALILEEKFKKLMRENKQRKRKLGEWDYQFNLNNKTRHSKTDSKTET